MIVVLVRVATSTCNKSRICTLHRCFDNQNCIRMQIELFNEIGQSASISCNARIVDDLPYDFIIGLATIRRYTLAKVFDEIFQELEGVSRLFDTPPATTTSPTSAMSSYPCVEPMIDRATGIHKSIWCNPLAHDTFVARMEGQPSNPDTCQCAKRHLWCLKCSTAGSQPNPLVHSAYDTSLINMLSSTNTAHQASIHLTRVVMSKLMQALVESSHINAWRVNKEDLLV
jgi:hypothetical protein